MKVKEIMTREVGVCNLDDSLAKAVSVMWQRDCGVVPVVNGNNIVVGMITDRDVTIALGSRNLLATEVAVGDVISGDIVCCSKDDSVKKALKKMRKHKVKRLPVTSNGGELAGIVSIADVLNLRKKKSLKKLAVKTLGSIAKPRAIIVNE